MCVIMNDIIKNRNVEYIDKVVEKLLSRTILERWGHNDTRIVQLPYFEMGEGMSIVIDSIHTTTHFWYDMIVLFDLNEYESKEVFIKWKNSLRKMM